MSNPPETSPNGFTAVNDSGTAQNLAVKALNHKDWSTPNGDSPNGTTPYPNVSKRSYDEIDDGADENRPPPPPPALNGSYDPQIADLVPQAQTQPTPSRESNGNGYIDEAHMADLLQRESRQESESQSDHLEDDSPLRGSQSAVEGTSPMDHNINPANGPIITNAGLQVDMKKRKRAFTNRTKTGCATCRKRKKKCDEGKPACSNCIRGGFTCLGYSQKKDLGPKGPNLARTPNPNIAPAREGYWGDQSGVRNARGPSFDDGSNGLPLNVHDRHAPIHDQRMNSWAPSFSARLPPPPPFASSSRDLSMGSRHVSYAASDQAPMLAAHDAARHYGHSSTPRRDFPPRPTSVENGSSDLHMARGNRFKPTEGLFTKDRDDCRALCAKLNSAIFEGSGIEEIRRRFQSIVQPVGRGSSSPTSSTTKPGSVGKNVSVDAPFRADYGYNLNIGDNVFIEGGCVFKDPAPIHIGAGTRIGTNVVISGEYMMPDPTWHDYSMKITIRIGTNCVIGTGCIIAATDRPELVIGDNVYISPGTVITQDIPSGIRVPALPPPYDEHRASLAHYGRRD